MLLLLMLLQLSLAVKVDEGGESLGVRGVSREERSVGRESGRVRREVEVGAGHLGGELGGGEGLRGVAGGLRGEVVRVLVLGPPDVGETDAVLEKKRGDRDSRVGEWRVKAVVKVLPFLCKRAPRSGEDFLRSTLDIFRGRASAI